MSNLPSEPEFEQAYKGLESCTSSRVTGAGRCYHKILQASIERPLMLCHRARVNARKLQALREEP